jgi:phage terminase large subunit-like protein
VTTYLLTTPKRHQGDIIKTGTRSWEFSQLVVLGVDFNKAMDLLGAAHYGDASLPELEVLAHEFVHHLHSVKQF